MKRTMLLLAAGLLACQPSAPPQEAAVAGPAKGTPEWKIQNAMSAAPASIASAAAVIEFTAPDAPPTQLRAGTNGWTCIVDNAGSPGNDPMCVDQTFIAWAGAWMAHKKPELKGVGFAYMLQGGSDASNTDPFKMAPDAGKPWVDTGPHVMVVVPGAGALTGISTDFKSTGPFVMWSNTPYAHVMMPVK